MNTKALNIIFLMLLSSSSLYSKDYIRLKEPFIIPGINVKILKNEIFPSADGNKLLYGNEAIEIDQNKIEKLEGIDERWVSTKLDYVKNTDNVNYRIDVSKLLNAKDTIKLVKRDNSTIPFFNNEIKNVSIVSCGEVFRLVVPNKPSLVYYQNEIPGPIPLNAKEQQETFEKERNKTILFLQIEIGVLIALVLLLIIGLALKNNLLKKTIKSPIEEKYTGGNFNDFAKKYGISRKQLFKMNKKELSAYEKLRSDSEKDQFKKNFIGKLLIVGYSNVNSGDLSAMKDFIEQIQTTEVRIINRIEASISNNNMVQKLEEQEKLFNSLKEKNEQIYHEKEKISQKSLDIQEKLTQLEKDYQYSLSENARFSDKILFVEYIEPYARVALDFFLLAKTGQQQAIDFFEKLNNTDSANKLLLGQFILKFHASISKKTGNWEEICYGIKERKVISNFELIRSIKNIPTDDEKLREFKRIFYKEVLEKYTSNLLILTEELSNLSKFTEKDSIHIQEIEQYFKKFRIELQNRIKLIGLDLNYVPLFENYIKYAAYTKSANQICSFPYQNIKNLERDTVLEVISYGFGNEDTKVILV